MRYLNIVHNVQGFAVLIFRVTSARYCRWVKVESQGIFQSSVMFVKLGLQLISDISMSIYSEASIAENPFVVEFMGRYFIDPVVNCGIRHS
jgi:hypothetical protein